MGLRLITAQPMREGAGVTVHRSIGGPALRHLDPFLLLDHFASDRPEEYLAGFPDHPHRGFNTVTYMLDGRMQHRDSVGNQGDLDPGGVQWMKAGSGIIHSEIPQQEAGLMRGFQLWINLPGSEKMSDPAYQEFSRQRIPVVGNDAAQVKVICGGYRGAVGPVSDPHTEVVYLDVALTPGARIELTVPARANAFACVYEGAVDIQGQTIEPQQLAVLEATVDVFNTGANGAARFIFVSGKPIGEPIVRYGPFVMNTSSEIEQALRDYRDGTLVRTRAMFDGPASTE